ncbi:MAG: D-alanine--D-alanine ligase [Candidatus Omnitrophica bacterium]|nr:D-alanine--D-alanine ligase [Candidatus Omnitrophota bacterium]
MAELNLGRIGVLMGGPSMEREISLKSGHAVYEALVGMGVEAILIDIKTDGVEENIELLKSHKISCAFLALHGSFGEDGQIQEILENIKIPYTGSAARASRLAMDKVASRKIFSAAGLSVPDYEVLERDSFGPGWEYRSNLGLPLVVKPASNGSSIGLSIVDKKEEIKKAVQLALGFDERAILERYIPSRELTVGIVEEEALAVIEIIPKKRFFDYEAKYQIGMTEYVVPAELEEGISKKVQGVALKAHNLLGCFGCSRVDILLDERGIPFVLELNSIPGFTPTSLLPKSARVAGIDFVQLCLKLIQLAYERTQVSVSH